MKEKIYEVTIGKPVWIGRDKGPDSYVTVHAIEPCYDEKENCWFSQGYVVSWCYGDFSKITGFTIRKGRCIGPVYIGVAE